MNDPNIQERLDRIEKAIGELKSERKQLDPVSQQLSAASKKFIEKPTLESAKVFLGELDSSSKLVPTARAAAWTTVTITVVTIVSDDQAG